MKPDERHSESPQETLLDPLDDSSSEPVDGDEPPTGDPGWRLWPPSPKMQIAMIALGFGLFNLILIVIWAVVMVYRF